jgi:programmed cell death protein 4
VNGDADRQGQSSLSSEPLLNEEQRLALEAALSGSLVEKTDSSSVELKGVPPPLSNGARPKAGNSVTGKPKKEGVYHDHHLSRRGKGTGKAKKHGGGGRFTWGKIMDPFILESEDAAADSGDPNWDSELEDGCSLVEERTVQVVAYKNAVADILFEYFNSGDLEETTDSLDEMDHPELAYYFVKRAITFSLDRHDKEREMVSSLLSELYDKSIDAEQMQKGFEAVVEGLDDLVLDVPQAVELLAFFTCRAIADDILPPSFLKDVEQNTEIMRDWHHRCQAYLADPHFAERMSRIWGSKAGMDLNETKVSFSSSLKEYVASGDVEEVRRILHSLSVPYFHHELVKQAIQLGIEMPETIAAIGLLLNDLCQSGDITRSQLLMGMERISELLSQIQLDNPNAIDCFDRILDTAISNGWVLQEEYSDLKEKIKSDKDSCVFSLEDFKIKCKETIKEYFESGDKEEVAQQLIEFNDPGLHNAFVKILVQLAMDRNDREREMASVLICELFQSSVISQEQIEFGFKKIISSAEDMTLDIPEASQYITLFIGRAIVDEVLTPRFLADTSYLKDGKMGLGILRAVKSLVSAKHAAERFTSCWHSFPAQESEVLSKAITDMIKEYCVSKTFDEVIQSLADLAAPHFHHEIIYQALIRILEEPSHEKTILELLSKLYICGEINTTQADIGYKRLLKEKDDLELDYIGAKQKIAIIGTFFTDIGMLPNGVTE